MNWVALDAQILLPALAAGLIVTATHVPLGIQVLNRGIVFIDLAIAQIAGLGVLTADWLGYEPHGLAVQLSALAAALIGAFFFNWSDRRWPEVQEATIGVAFIVAASLGILLLAGNPHGGEHLKDLLVGQILWVGFGELPRVGVISTLILAVWFGLKGRIGQIGFYLLFACAVTISVQLVGLYLVFASLIVPALATRHLTGRRLAIAYVIGAAGYLFGLIVSALTDLPSGAVIVCIMTLIGCIAYLLVPSVRR